MPFLPLNKQEETEHDIEKHIREVELENALKLYQHALKLHHQRSWDAAGTAYDDLLASDVLIDVISKGPHAHRESTSDDVSTVQSSVTLLPYLIFKNHGSLLIDRLKSEVDAYDPGMVRDLLEQVLIEYATALSYEEEDFVVWRHVSWITESLGLSKLNQFSLECEVSNSKNVLGGNSSLLWEEDATSHELLASRKLLATRQASYGHKVAELSGSESVSGAHADSWLKQSQIAAVVPYAGSACQTVVIHPSGRTWYALGRAIAEKHRVIGHGRSKMPIHFHLDFSLSNSQSDRSSDELSDDNDLSSIASAQEPINDTNMTIHSPPQVDTPKIMPDDCASLQSSNNSSTTSSRKDQNTTVYVHRPIDVAHLKLSNDALDIPSQPSTMSVDIKDVDRKTWQSLHDSEHNRNSDADDFSGPFRDNTVDNAFVDVPEDAPIRVMRAHKRHLSTPDVQHRKRRYDKVLGNSEEDFVTRASKRVKERNEETNPANDKYFLGILDDLGKILNVSFELLTNLDRDSSFPLFVENSCHKVLVDLKLFLFEDWDDEKVQVSSKLPQCVLGPSFSKTMILNFPPLQSPVKDDECDINSLSTFLDGVEKDRTYFRDFGVEWLLALLDGDAEYFSSYLSTPWSDNLRNLVQRFIVAEERLLLCRVTETLGSNSPKRIKQALLWSEAVLELCLDEVTMVEKARLEQNTASLLETDTMNRAHRWRSQVLTLRNACNDQKLLKHIEVRYSWACALIKQLLGHPVDEIIASYEYIKSLILEQDDFVLTNLPNSQTIANISIYHLESEISKFSTLDFFNEVFQSSSAQDYPAVQRLLEPVLMPEQSPDEAITSLLDTYLSRTPLDFRRQLWLMLAKAFESQNMENKALFASTQGLTLLVESLYSDQYSAKPRTERQKALLQALQPASQILKNCTEWTKNSPCALDGWTMRQTQSTLSGLILLVTMQHVFVHYEDVVDEDDSPTRSSIAFKRFRERTRIDVVRTWALIYLCVKKGLTFSNQSTDATDHQLAMLINGLHDELGTRGYCCVDHGLLLNLFEEELFRLNRAETENDLIQVLHCRYNISYSCGTFTPWDHLTTGTSPSREQALRILPFVTTFLHEKTPGVLLPKSDLKAALDVLHEATWSSVMDGTVLSRESAILDAYLEQELTPQMLRESLVGSTRLTIQNRTNSNHLPQDQYAAFRDLSYNLGWIHLSQFRNRNKNNNRGLADLAEAQAYFKLDLLLSPERIESWKSLASIQASLADNELSWDAQHIWEAREGIADLQKQTILCYMMAINLFLQNVHNTDHAAINQRHRFADLLFNLGYQIYNAARAPLEMMAFARKQTRYMERGLARPVSERLPEVSATHALKISRRCLHRAASNCTDKWRCYLMLGKIHEKLGALPEVALEVYVKAIELAPKNAGLDQGPLFEPHHRMLSSLYKFVLRDAITPKEAFKFLVVSPFTKRHLTESIESKEQIVSAIRASLNGLRIADKRHWQHRPVHRLAVIARNSLEISEARSELEGLFTSRGSASNLLNIWRPEHERPGRHFVYTNRYSLLYTDLLFIQEDMEAIKTFMRRVRKAMQNVLHHKELWDTLCRRYLDVNIKKHNIEALNHLKIIDVVETTTFNEISAKLERRITSNDFELPTFEVLKDFYDLRKLNGGLYETQKIDDPIIDCYLKLYNIIAAEVQIIKEDLVPQLESTMDLDNPRGLDETHIEHLQAQGVHDPSSSNVIEPVITLAPWINNPIKPKKQPKEQRITRVLRKDILSKAFSLCKPRPVVNDDHRRDSSIRSKLKNDPLSGPLSATGNADEDTQDQSHDADMMDESGIRSQDPALRASLRVSTQQDNFDHSLHASNGAERSDHGSFPALQGEELDEPDEGEDDHGAQPGSIVVDDGDGEDGDIDDNDEHDDESHEGDGDETTDDENDDVEDESAVRIDRFVSSQGPSRSPNDFAPVMRDGSIEDSGKAEVSFVSDWAQNGISREDDEDEDDEDFEDEDDEKEKEEEADSDTEEHDDDDDNDDDDGDDEEESEEEGEESEEAEQDGEEEEQDEGSDRAEEQELDHAAEEGEDDLVMRDI